MPKGVVWRHEDLFFAALGGGDPRSTRARSPIRPSCRTAPRLPDDPAVRPAAHARQRPLGGVHHLLRRRQGRAARPGRFDGAEVWRTMAAENVNVLTVVGDAMARPVLDALAADPTYDTSSLFAFASGGALLSPATKAQVAELLPNVLVVDAFGSSETGLAGSRPPVQATPAGARFTVDERTAVLGDDLRPVVPGSGVIGRLARQGHVPLGYYKDDDQDGRHVRHRRRRALGAPRRHGHRRRGRHGRAARAGLGLDQHRRREGVPRGGRGRPQGPPRGVRRARRRCARRAVGRDRRRRRGHSARPRPDPRRAQRVRPRGLAGYKLPGASSWSTRCPRAANGKPDYARAERPSRWTGGVRR